MPDAPYRPDIDLFAATTHGLSDPDPVHAALRAAGPVVQVDVPAGGRAWVVTDAGVARTVFTDPRITKDPAWAPSGWDRLAAGLEPDAAVQPSLTTLDGPGHQALRRAHAPLLNAGRMRERAPRVRAIARKLLTDLADLTHPTDRADRADRPGTRPPGTVDLMADFTTRYPLTVLLDLLGIPLDHLDRAADACRLMLTGDTGRAIPELMDIASTGLEGGVSDDGVSDDSGLAAELRERMPDGTAPAELRYHLFALIFAGQLTTDAALGTLIAHALADPGPTGPTTTEALVDATLRRHPPAPLGLWRYTTTAMELAGAPLPARAPVLVDIQGIDTDPARPPGPHLAFGAGPHFCVGARLALLELTAVVDVLRADFPGARLGVPFPELRLTGPGGLVGSRLTALPVALRP